MFTRHHPHWPPALPKTLSIPATSLCYNLQVSADRYPRKTAINYYGRTIDFERLKREVDALAGWLQQVAGVKRGDRVLLGMQNSPQFVIGYYAVLRADAAVVPVNPMLRVDELGYLAADSGARVALFGQELATQWVPLVDNEIAHAVVAAYSDYLPDDPDPALAKFALPEAVTAPRDPRFGAGSSGAAPAGAVGWMDAIGQGRVPALPLAGPDDLAVLPYTSGTTGQPKGCIHTHRTVMSTAVGNCAWFGVGADSVQLSVLPMFHVTGMQGGMNGPIFAGLTVVMMSRWDRELAARLIERYRVTSVTGITTMIIDFLATPGLVERDLSSLTRIGGGGAAMPEAVAAKLESLLGLPFIEGYGLTETMAPSHINPPHRPKRQCAGIPIFGTDARVLDVETGDERGPGETGEIVVRGPQVFGGYWNRKDASDAAFIDVGGNRFFRTGDLGHHDEDGYFYITDRLKRMINCSGFKVWPAEVEAMLHAHPDIAEACVIASRDEHRGETVKAVVVLAAQASKRLRETGGADEIAASIVAWSREKMAAYKVPRVVEFVPALPRTATGKVFWRMLQESEEKKWT